MGKTSWSALFGLGCFSSHRDKANDDSKNATKATSRPPKPAPTPAPLPSRLSCNDLKSGSSNGGMPSPEDLSLSLVGSGVQAFTVEEHRTATRDFSMSNFVGEGGFGPVYNGYVDERLNPGVRGQAVAVKLLDLEGSRATRSGW